MICLSTSLGKRRKDVNEKDVLLISCLVHVLALIYAFTVEVLGSLCSQL